VWKLYSICDKMVVKVFISGISASKEVKKRQQRAQMLLDSLKVKYDLVDITEPGHESEKELMKNVCKKRNNNAIALPPQFFNDDQYCGDYEDLESASDDDMVLSFLKLEEDITIENGDVSPNEEQWMSRPSHGIRADVCTDWLLQILKN